MCWEWAVVTLALPSAFVATGTHRNENVMSMRKSPLVASSVAGAISNADRLTAVTTSADRLTGTSGEWLVADIGGTHARFDCWNPRDGLARGACRTYRNDDFADIAAVIHAYRRDVGSQARQAMLAVALPISGKASLPMTNRAWTLDSAHLRATAGLTRLCLVNDLVAAAAGIHALGPAELEASAGNAVAAAPKVLIGVGTGLGAAIVLDDPEETRILASEAGHMTAAVDTDEARAVRDLAARLHGRVSWERLLSGSGLGLFDAVARAADPPVAAAEVAARALVGEPQAVRATNAFAHALGQFAGDLCLVVGALGGVYLTGGVLQGLDAALNLGKLRAGFENKGRFAGQLRSVPLVRVHAGDLAARGLDRLLAGAVRAPVLDL